jgi:hypothetical protein
MAFKDWFGGSDGDKSAYRVSRDKKDGSFRHERLTQSDKKPGGHFHDVAKTSTDGKHKEFRGAWKKDR